MKGKRPVIIFKNNPAYYLFHCYARMWKALGFPVGYPSWAKKRSLLLWEKVESESSLTIRTVRAMPKQQFNEINEMRLDWYSFGCGLSCGFLFFALVKVISDLL